MDWTQAYTIIGINIALMAFLATIMVWMVNKIDIDVKSVGERIDKFGSRLDGHATRIDQLYKMFVDLLNKDK